VHRSFVCAVVARLPEPTIDFVLPQIKATRAWHWWATVELRLAGSSCRAGRSGVSLGPEPGERELDQHFLIPAGLVQLAEAHPCCLVGESEFVDSGGTGWHTSVQRPSVQNSSAQLDRERSFKKL
jgi:hypothetical protein